MGTDSIGLSQPFRFTGREPDAETGAHGAHRLSTLQPDPGPAAQREASGGHAPRARYYSPDMRRFISEDPIRKSIGLLATLGAGDVNFYAYVGNNPVNFVDPSGLETENIAPYTVRIDKPHVKGQQTHAHIKGGDIKAKLVINIDGSPSHGTTCKLPKNKNLLKYLKGKGFYLSLALSFFIYDDIGEFIGDAMAWPISGASEAW